MVSLISQVPIIVIVAIAAVAFVISVHLICKACVKVKEMDVTETLEKEKLYQAERARR